MSACAGVSARPAPAPAGSPAFTGYVVDRADLMSTAQEHTLAERLGRVQRQTGRRVAVATLPNLRGASIERYGLALANAWGVGRRGVNDGVLLLFAVKEHSVRIEVGCGLETALTDAEAATVIRDRIIPAFRAGRFGGGVSAGVDGVLREIAPGVR